MRRALVTLALLLGTMIAPAVRQEPNPRLEALKKYILEKDYPEVFGDADYKTRIEDVLDVDIDNDGSKEFVVQYFPHYRQSPPIVIYKVNANLEVKKVTEGLAPGPLQPLSGDYLDSHSLGMAIDMENPGKKTTPEDLFRTFTKNGMNGFVAYDQFFHIDGRKGSLSYIDMTGVSVPMGKHDCSGFEFSRVKQIAAGGPKEDPTRNYLAAWVGDEIWVYLIRGISQDGMLDKQLWAIKAPKGFEGFEPGQGLTYKTDAGMAILTLK
jgi:hypothetical protein